MKLPSYWIIPAQRKIEKDITIRINSLIKRVCKSFSLSEKKLMSKRRFREYVTARNVTMYILHKHYGVTSTRAGAIFNKDHSTAIYACKSIAGFMEYDEAFRNKVKYLI